MPYIISLKGRRKILSSIKERMKKLNISLLDISGKYSKEGQLAAVFLILKEKEANEKIQKIDKLLQKFENEIEYEIEYEIL
jgi:ACT domain-containing protein